MATTEEAMPQAPAEQPSAAAEKPVEAPAAAPEVKVEVEPAVEKPAAEPLAAAAPAAAAPASAGTASKEPGVRQYLESSVVPILMQGMQSLVKEKPEDPVGWLAEFLQKNNPKKRKAEAAAVVKTDAPAS